MNAGLASILVSSALGLMVGGCGHQSMGKHDAMTGGAQVTEGAIITTSTGAERKYALTGNASMRRISHNRTTVKLEIAGLHAHEKYPSHVHNLHVTKRVVADTINTRRAEKWMRSMKYG
ncbi:MAG: hypothetical protein ACPGYT_11000 [Nitrospirales bacterium]